MSSKRIYCEHCKEEVAKSTFYRHYHRFYNPVSKKWDYDPELADHDSRHSRASVSQGEYLDINGEQVYSVCVILLSPPRPPVYTHWS